MEGFRSRVVEEEELGSMVVDGGGMEEGERESTMARVGVWERCGVGLLDSVVAVEGRAVVWEGEGEGEGEGERLRPV